VGGDMSRIGGIGLGWNRGKGRIKDIFAWGVLRGVCGFYKRLFLDGMGVE